MLQSRAPLQMAGGGSEGSEAPGRGCADLPSPRGSFLRGQLGRSLHRCRAELGSSCVLPVSSLWAQGTVPATLSRRMNEGRKERGRMNE